MEDRTGDLPAAADEFRRLLDGCRHRWHAAPGDGLLFVLDDGTGDVELRFRPDDNKFQAALTRRDIDFARFEGSLGDDSADFQGALDDAVDQNLSGLSGESGKGKTRFIVSFEAAQLAGLRETADLDRVPVAEVVRRAVADYLAARKGPPAAPGG